MENRKIVVALGRDCFGNSFSEQKDNVRLASKAVADVVEERYSVIVTHSNGQQLALIHSAMEDFAKEEEQKDVAPMSVCSAMSEGYIGFDLQNGIRTELLNRGIYKTVSTIITQVKVSPFDKAFSKPTKKIGRVLSKEEADKMEASGKFVTEVEGGYRRVVATPAPIDIYEMDAIRTLVDAGQVVIAAGGGGIPVLEQGTVLKGARSIIEKDATAGMLAQLSKAGTLLFVTGTEKAAAFYGTVKERLLDEVTLDTVKNLKLDNAFEGTGMLPKIKAAITFLENNNEGRVIITDMEHVSAALKGRTGTIITA